MQRGTSPSKEARRKAKMLDKESKQKGKQLQIDLEKGEMATDSKMFDHTAEFISFD